MPSPIFIPPIESRLPNTLPQANGQSFIIQEWSGSGPDYLHVHHADDEAWHVLEGTLTFRFQDRDVDASAGTTVFVPAGVPHAYYEAHAPTDSLYDFRAIHEQPDDRHSDNPTSVYTMIFMNRLPAFARLPFAPTLAF